MLAQAPDLQCGQDIVADDQIATDHNARSIPDAWTRAGQRPRSHGAELRRTDLPTVALRRDTGFIEYRRHEAAAEVFVSARTPDAELYQPFPGNATLLPEHVDATAERLVREPEQEVLGELGCIEPQTFEVRQRARSLVQGFVVVLDHDAEWVRVAVDGPLRVDENARRGLHDPLDSPQARRVVLRRYIVAKRR